MVNGLRKQMSVLVGWNKTYSIVNNNFIMSLVGQSMMINPQTLFRQIVSQAGITNKDRQQLLKRQIDKKYSIQMGLIQSHSLRDNRFVFSQKQVLKRQHESIEKTKKIISIKQDKAENTKIHTLANRIKKTELNLNRWEHIIQKNKIEHKDQLKHSEKLIKNWNEKLSSSNSRKSLRLSQFSKNHRERTAQIEHRVQSTRRILEGQHLKESKINQSMNHLSERYQSTCSKANSRVSTESISDKKRKLDEFTIEKQLIKTIRKQQKITAARSMRLQMFSKRIKQRQNKQQYLKKLREDNLNGLKVRIEEKNLILDDRFKKNKKHSLPQINQFTPNMILFRDVSEDRCKNKYVKTEQSKLYQPSYDRIIREKLRDITMSLRRPK